MTLVMTPNEVAVALRMRLADVYKLLESGDIPAYRDKSAWKIPVKSLEKYVEGRAEEESRERGKVAYESRENI